jgi:hypothetical protein
MHDQFPRQRIRARCGGSFIGCGKTGQRAAAGGRQLAAHLPDMALDEAVSIEQAFRRR